MVSRRTAQALLRQLPESLDLLAVTVSAGLGLQGAIAEVAEQVDGALGTEWRRVLADIRLGSSLPEALTALAERCDIPEIRHFTASVILAAEMGTAIGPVLKAQAEHARKQRLLRLTELAHKVPVKVVFPLVFCLLPSLLLIVVGPAVITVLDELGSTGW